MGRDILLALGNKHVFQGRGGKYTLFLTETAPGGMRFAHASRTESSVSEPEQGPSCYRTRLLKAPAFYAWGMRYTGHSTLILGVLHVD